MKRVRASQFRQRGDKEIGTFETICTAVATTTGSKRAVNISFDSVSNHTTFPSKYKLRPNDANITGSCVVTRGEGDVLNYNSSFNLGGTDTVETVMNLSRAQGCKNVSIYIGNPNRESSRRRLKREVANSKNKSKDEPDEENADSYVEAVSHQKSHSKSPDEEKVSVEQVGEPVNGEEKGEENESSNQLELKSHEEPLSHQEMRKSMVQTIVEDEVEKSIKDGADEVKKSVRDGGDEDEQGQSTLSIGFETTVKVDYPAEVEIDNDVLADVEIDKDVLSPGEGGQASTVNISHRLSSE